MITQPRTLTLLLTDFGLGLLLLFVILLAASDFSSRLLREESGAGVAAAPPDPIARQTPEPRRHPLREVPPIDNRADFSEMAHLRRENAALANRLKGRDREVRQLQNENIALLNENRALSSEPADAARPVDEPTPTAATDAPSVDDIPVENDEAARPVEEADAGEPAPVVVAHDVPTPPPPAVIVEEPMERAEPPASVEEAEPVAIPEAVESAESTAIPEAVETATADEAVAPLTPEPEAVAALEPTFPPVPAPLRRGAAVRPPSSEGTVTFLTPTRLLGALEKGLRAAGIPARPDDRRMTLYVPGVLDFERDETGFSTARMAGMERLAAALARLLPCYAHGGAGTDRGGCPESHPDGELDAIVIAGHSGQGPVGSQRFRASWRLANQRALRTLTTLLSLRPELKALRNRSNRSLFRVDGFLPDSGDPDRNPRRVELRFIMTNPEEAPLPG